jgi:hypothetical protein
VVEATSSNYATVTYLRQGIRRSAESMCDKSSVTYDDALAAHTYPLYRSCPSTIFRFGGRSSFVVGLISDWLQDRGHLVVDVDVDHDGRVG